MIVFDERDALNGLRQAVSGKGAPYVYQWTQCMYTDEVDGTLEPRCMVGYALAALGIPLQLVAKLGNKASIAELAQRLREHGYSFTSQAVEVLNIAQLIQDGAAFVWISKTPDGEIFSTLMPGAARTWGTALDAAQRHATTQAVETQIKDTVEQIVHFTQQQSALAAA